LSCKASSHLVAGVQGQATFVKISSAIQAKGYSNEESKDKTLQMQVCREVTKIKGGDPPPPPEAAAVATTALLTQLAMQNTTKWAMVDNNYTVAIA
jgi:hypothetical protein